MGNYGDTLHITRFHCRHCPPKSFQVVREAGYDQAARRGMQLEDSEWFGARRRGLFISGCLPVLCREWTGKPAGRGTAWSNRGTDVGSASP